ncbi:serine hydrolase domain-containing protein [Flindersiella endophytica]
MVLAMTGVFLVSGVPGITSKASAAAGDHAVSDAIASYVDNYRKATGMPAVTVAVTQGRSILYVGGSGQDSDGAAVDGRTRMPVASVSKSFTALAVMQLVEAGRVQLDRPVRTYLPEFRMADPRANRITVRQLLDQSSGLSTVSFPTADLPVAGSLREAVRQLTAARLDAPPGAVWSYHNANYWVAARMVEVVAGEKFDEYLNRRIFAPLGMGATTAMTVSTDQSGGQRLGYNQLFGFPVSHREIPEFAAGAGGVVSTAADMANWLIAQNSGGVGPSGQRVLSAAGIGLTHQPSAPGGEYGLGWFAEPDPSGGTKIYHGGTAWTYCSQQALLSKEKYGIVVLSNSRPAFADDTLGLVEGLTATLRNGSPEPGRPYRLWTELVMTALAGLVIAANVIVVLRARRWASRVRHLWAVPVRLAPYVVTAVLAALFPTLMSRLGWDINWHQLFVVGPSTAVLLNILAIGAAAVLVTRIHWLIRQRRNT